MASSSTAKSRILSLVEEAEVLTRDLGEATSAVRQRVSQPDEPQIMEILMKKNQELEATLKETEDQRKMKQEVEGLQEEVDKRDEDIKTLQKQLKEAEYMLATAIYQAKEKLKAIRNAKKGAISSEELIKYAHRISATNAVSAPLTWAPGDPRRPYPTDLEMRMGILGRLSNVPTYAAGESTDAGQPGGASTWKPSSELTANLSMSSGLNRLAAEGSIDLNVPGHKENEEDVEIMSSDSESSSSSDSF